MPLHGPDAETLTIWTIYASPSDYPGRIVVRRSTAGPDATQDQKPWIVAQSVTEARQSLPDQLMRIERMPDDDPAIVEVWL